MSFLFKKFEIKKEINLYPLIRMKIQTTCCLKTRFLSIPYVPHATGDSDTQPGQAPTTLVVLFSFVA